MLFRSNTQQRQSQKPQSPVIPTSFVGKDGVFGDPAVHRALARAGWGGNTRQQVERMLSKLPESQKQEWERQFSGGR